jgi:DNA-binding response OmpR family regulator
VRLLVLTDRSEAPQAVVPALAALGEDVVKLPLGVSEGLADLSADVVLVDATGDLGRAVSTCRSAAVQGLERPLLVVLTFGALAAVKVTWGFDDWLVPEASAGELRTRVRLAQERLASQPAPPTAGALQIDPIGYRAHLRGEPLELTFTEFELLRALVRRGGHVWSRAALLREVWGYHHHPVGTRTVDVHVTRLRAKLGSGAGAQIQTVRNVGYKLVLADI